MYSTSTPKPRRTLQLPAPIHAELRAASERTGISMSRIAADALHRELERLRRHRSRRA